MKLNFFEKIIVMNPLRRWIQKNIETSFLLSKGEPLAKNARVLEIGASIGYGAACIKDYYNIPQVLAVEYDMALLQKRTPTEGVLYMQASGHQLPVAEDSLDALVSFGVLHHIINWQSAVEEWSYVLKEGGQVFLEEFYAPLITNSFVNFFIKHPQENRFTHEEMVAVAKSNGFKVTYQKSFLGLMGWVVLQK